MEFKIIIDDRIFHIIRKTFRRRIVIPIIAVMFILAGAVAIAAISVPNTFTSGSTISSSEVNSNFTTLVSQINTNTADIAKITVTQRQFWYHTADQNTMITLGNLDLKFDLGNFTSSGASLLTSNNDNASTRWVAQKDCTIHASFAGDTTAGAYFRILVNGAVRFNEYSATHGGATTTFKLSANDYFEFNLSGATFQNTAFPIYVNIVAEAEFAVADL